jgi:WD40 repeat protein
MEGDILTCSDDKSIALWGYDEKEKKYLKKKEWKEHGHFVMDLKKSPKEDGVFASGSLDKTIRLWHIKGENSNGTLRGHQAGVNCIAYHTKEK